MTENLVAQRFGALAQDFMGSFDEEAGEVPLCAFMAVWSKRPGPGSAGGVGVRWHMARGGKSASKAETLKLLDDLRAAVSEASGEGA